MSSGLGEHPAGSTSAIKALGVDAGGTNVRLCAISGAPARVGAIARASWRTDGQDSVDALGAAIVAGCLEVSGQPPAALGVPIGVGIAAQLSPDGRVVKNAPNIGWRDVPLASLLESRLSVPAGTVRLENDVNAILQGELGFGAARGASDVLAMYWGTGIGGAVAIDGRVRVGAGGNMGEVGHVKQVGDATLCGCGERGCIEAQWGGAALLRRLGRDVASGLAGHLAPDDGAALHPGVIDAAAASGDAYAMSLWTEAAESVGTALANAATLLNPSHLVLGGGVWSRCPTLAAMVRAVVERQTLAVCRASLTMVDGTLGDEAGVLGAGYGALVAKAGPED